MKSVATKRIGKDLRLLLEDVKAHGNNNSNSSNSDPLVVSVDSESVYQWRVVAKPPTSSVYNSTSTGTTYELSVIFSEDYPHEPPTVRFLTAVYSPLVTPEGEVCERLIGADWSPAQHAADAILLVLNKVFRDYKNSIDEDVHPEARTCLETAPQEFASRARRGH
ncbi:ubiquitin-conjugating enzyme E2 [Trypanosoma grayi]|uniref:ubiquitin-conjugating enzyme E2 n=1 Tax=Trypanosoma grayi TaxID=71804 RepID=UPI0004F462A1|nr:ubiquitin-conjugating enzyme E2 [Trypanosoma grayi]KEG12525.1 ubiquitin-conjugating enzyme E2 [Trypanosoma grayi]